MATVRLVIQGLSIKIILKQYHVYSPYCVIINTVAQLMLELLYYTLLQPLLALNQLLAGRAHD